MPRRSSRSTTAWIVVAILAAGAIVGTVTLGGCWWRKPATPPATTSPEPVASTERTVKPEPSAEPTPAADENPMPPVSQGGTKVYTPPSGSDERQAIADAVRERLNTTSRFVVAQLYSNGAWAIGQFTPQGGTKSRLVAVRLQEDTGWMAFWDAAPGSASADAVLAVDDRFPEVVLAKVSWAGKAPAAEGKPGQPSASEAIVAAKRFVQAQSDVTIEKASLEGMTKDSQGRWWAWVIVEAKNVDPAQVLIYKSAGQWKLHDFGSEVSPPAGVEF